MKSQKLILYYYSFFLTAFYRLDQALGKGFINLLIYYIQNCILELLSFANSILATETLNMSLKI